jgi:ribosomal protein S18 acetylase RimI-like enzyme
MDISIRPYKPADELSVKQCIDELKRCEHKFESGMRLEPQATDELLTHLLANKASRIFVAEIADAVVGFIALAIENINDKRIVGKIDTVCIADIIVLPSYRNQGIGNQLLQEAVGYARSLYIHYLKLTTFADNQEARMLYQKFGFHDYEITMIKELT